MALALRPGYRALLQAFGTTVAFGMLLQPAIADDTVPVQKISVTGSSIKRIQSETSLPVQVLGRKDLEREGVSSAAELLNNLASNNGGGYSLANAVGDSGQPGFSGASLRGLGSSNTLVLLNGKRLANHPFNGASVDLNAIPMAAIDRVEVLKDGASAIYGSDAIGGVINFITRKDYQGFDASAHTMWTEAGGGEQNKVTLSGGYGDPVSQGFNVFGVVNYTKNNSLKAVDRSFSKTGYIPEKGINKLSFQGYPANAIDAKTFADAGAYANPAAPNCSGALSRSVWDPTDPTACYYDYTAALDILPPTETTTGLLSGTYNINEHHHVSAEYMYVRNKATFASSETPVSEFTTFNGDPLLYPAGGAYYPTGLFPGYSGDVGLFWRAVDAGPRTNEAVSVAQRLVLSAEGDVAGWDYKGSYLWARTKATDTYVNGWLFESKLLPAMYTGLINPFGRQTAEGQALLDSAKIKEPVRESWAETQSVDLHGSREIFNLPAGAVSMALGTEYRKEKLHDEPLAVLSSGDVLGGGGDQQPVSGDRSISALYAEFIIPVAKSLEADLAVRYDNYSDFGSTTNPKLGVRWQPTKNMLVRGSVGTGFRAPSLPELYQPVSQTNTADKQHDPECPVGIDPNGPLCFNQFDAKTGGNRELKPEESTQYSFGVLLEPINSLSVGVDYFNIHRKDSIGTLSDSTIFGSNYPKYKSLFTRKTDGTIDYVTLTNFNLGDVKTSGYDLSARYALPTSYGRFGVSLEGTYILEYKYQREKGGEYIDNLGNYEDGSPVLRWQHTLALSWDLGQWTVNLTNYYKAGYTDEHKKGEPDTKVEPYQTWDLQGQWRPSKAWTVTAGVINLEDTPPPFSRQGQTFQVGYDPALTDPRGRSYYVELGYSFK